MNPYPARHASIDVLYARVGVVHGATRPGQTYTYLIPAALADQLIPGQLLLVPFGQHSRRGWLLALEATLSPEMHAAMEKLKYVARLLCADPFFTRDQLALAEFICQHYRYPVGPFLWKLLPHGLVDRHAGDLVPHPGGAARELAGLRTHWPEATHTLDRLSTGHTVKVDELATILPADKQASFVNDVLHAHGASLQPGTGGVFSTSPAPLPDTAASQSGQRSGSHVLERGTRQALSAIFADIANQRGTVFVLTGKPNLVEIVGQITRCCLSSRLQTIALVPELRGSDHLAPALRDRFGPYPGAASGQGVAMVHSRVPHQERREQWLHLHHTPPALIIGTRLALFAPHRSLGAIIVLDEHSHSYKQEQQPRYHARDVALWQAKQHRATVVLISPTPDPVTFWQARRGPYRLLSPGAASPDGNAAAGARPRIESDHGKTDRSLRTDVQPVANGSALPSVTARLAPHVSAARSLAPPPPRRHAGEAVTAQIDLIDLRQELRMANITTVSRQLQSALRTTLAKGGQALLMLNRRGTNTQLMCTRCGYMARCGQCSVAMTYHTEPERLVCHYCNHEESPLLMCPHCMGRRLHFVGTGTQRVEQDIKRWFPAARIARWDRDTSIGPASDRAMIRQFSTGDLDILVGTQLLVTGVTLPQVELAAMLNTDVTLHLPDYRSAERTYYHVSALYQRVLPTGRLLIQTYSPEHWSLQAVVHGDPELFYREELRQRRALHYPPYSDLVRLVYSHANVDACRTQAEAVAKLLDARRCDLALRDAVVLGPAPAFIERVRGRTRWQLFLRGRNLHQLLDVVPRGWVIDVNPVSTL